MEGSGSREEQKEDRNRSQTKKETPRDDSLIDEEGEEKTKLYVAGLHWETSREKLHQLFGRYGKITAIKLIVDPFTGRSRGFGFISFATSEEATAARDAMNSADVDGRQIFVKKAMPEGQGGGSGGGGGRGGGRGFGRGGFGFGRGFAGGYGWRGGAFRGMHPGFRGYGAYGSYGAYGAFDRGGFDSYGGGAGGAVGAYGGYGGYGGASGSLGGGRGSSLRGEHSAYGRRTVPYGMPPRGYGSVYGDGAGYESVMGSGGGFEF